MGPGTIRLGGVLVFVNIAVTVLGIVIGGLLGADAARTGQTGAAGAVTLVVTIVQMLLTIFILLATKGLFNANQYRGGDIPILMLVVIGAAIFLIAMVAGIDPQGLLGRGGGQTAGIIGIVLLVLLLLYFVLALIFSINCMSFGGRGGGGLWKAVGILYLITMVLFVIAIVVLIATIASARGAEDAGAALAGGGIAGILFLIGILTGAAGLICHGIGLSLGAGKLEPK
jgi:hypothetical protein